jgi:hypothetical protein
MWSHSGINSSSPTEEQPMYIGLGTVVLIIIIFLLLR